MKKSTGYLKYTAVLALTAVLMALAVWITGMYRSSTASYIQRTDECLVRAANEELKMRIYSLDNFYTWIRPYEKSDSSGYISSTIELDDGQAFHVRIRKNDPTSITKVRQLYFHWANWRLNPAKVDSIFKNNMAAYYLPVKASYVEFLDLKKDSLISSSISERNLPGYLASHTDTLDIMKSLGLRVYTKASPFVIHRLMMASFTSAVMFIIIAIICIIRLITDIRQLHKDGFRLFRFVTLKAERSLRTATRQIEIVADKFTISELEEASAELKRAREGLVVDTGYFEKLGLIIRNEERKIKFTKTAFLIRPLLEKLRAKYESTIHKNVIITLLGEPDAAMYTDAYYLERIFEELLDNCVKYSNDPVLIAIQVVQERNKTIIVVCDTGWGIEQVDLNDLYIVNHDIAKRFKESIKQGTKPGLGLSFVISFVRALGGKVRINNEDLTGIKMTFYHTETDVKKITRIKAIFYKNFRNRHK